MGSANTPFNIQKIYQQLNLSMCSINTVEIPKSCTSYVFWNVFEHCLKHDNMIVLGVYKRPAPEEANQTLGEELFSNDKSKGQSTSSKGKKKKKKKVDKSSSGSGSKADGTQSGGQSAKAAAYAQGD